MGKGKKSEKRENAKVKFRKNEKKRKGGKRKKNMERGKGEKSN